MKGRSTQTIFRNDVRALRCFTLKLRSLGWRSWSVTLTWPKSLTFCKSYDLRKRKHLKLSTYSLRQELGKLRPQLGCLTDILSDTMSNQVLQNGGQATTMNQSSRSSSASIEFTSLPVLVNKNCFYNMPTTCALIMYNNHNNGLYQLRR